MKEIKYDQLRGNFLKYTRKAFAILPEMHKPRILDIGCGFGILTVELARLSNGEVIGIDIDQAALDDLNNRAKILGLSNRIKAMNCSMLELKFQDENFDIIWAEGAIRPIGFKRALKEWGRVLKNNGFMVVHDDLVGKKNKLKQIPKYGYLLFHEFQLPDDAWWVEYYYPLEKQINKLSIIYNEDPEFLEKIERFQDEIEIYKKGPSAFRSIFYILQKRI
ncbi:MAG: class I SAM-dependent methyltransferase [Promethearchaeota archaeon]